MACGRWLTGLAYLLSAPYTITCPIEAASCNHTTPYAVLPIRYVGRPRHECRKICDSRCNIQLKPLTTTLPSGEHEHGVEDIVYFEISIGAWRGSVLSVLGMRAERHGSGVKLLGCVPRTLICQGGRLWRLLLGCSHPTSSPAPSLSAWFDTRHLACSKLTVRRVLYFKHPSWQATF